MRKYFLIAAILASFHSSFSQYDYSKPIRQKIDSLNNILPKLRGNDKVDCLNELVVTYFDRSLGSWRAEADSARPFAIQANKEASRIGYKKGLAHSYLNLETIDCMIFGANAQGQRRFDSLAFNSAQQNAKNAITIAEELKDYNILGEAYFILNWLLNETRSTSKLIVDPLYIRKAIEYYEKADNKARLARSLEELYYLADTKITFKEGVEAMKKAISLYHEIDEGREILSCTNLTEMLLIKGEFEDALIIVSVLLR